MRRGWYGLIGILILISACDIVHAQTLYGPGGLFIHPTAFTSAKGQFGLNVSYYTQIVGANTTTEWLPVSLTYGVSDRAEIGALFVDRRFGQHRESGGAFARYQFLTDTASRPAFAVAGSYLDGDVKQSSISGVFSHALRRNGRTFLLLHAGAQWARRSDIARPGDSLSAFLAADVPIGDRFSLIAETGSKFSFDRHETSAFGVAWRANRSVQIGLGFVNTGRSKDNRFFAGVGYRIGGVDR